MTAITEATGTTTAAVGEDRLLIDRIIYLASLVSDPAAVDPMLDTLRKVTVHLQPEMALAPTERAELTALEQQLKTYLISSDPVRSFSPASLEANLQRYFNASGGAKLSVKRQLMAVISITIISYSIAVVLAGATSRKQLLSWSPVALTLLNFGIAWFFWSARKDYAREIRTMYGYFSTGVIIRSIAMVQFPFLLAAPHLRQHVVFQYVGFLPPFILMSMIFYLGMRLYARQLQLKTFLLGVWRVLGVSVLLAAAVFVFSRPTKAPSPVYFNISLASFLLSAYFSMLAALLARTVARHITSRYARSMRLLAASQVMFAVGCLCFSIVMVAVAGPLTNLEIGLSALSFVVPEILLLLSAYNAKRTVNEVGPSKSMPTA